MSQERDNWGSKFGFIMAAAGSAIGLGNIWRFPYLTGTSGGGAFLIVYIICAIFVGFSIMLAEFTLGRYTAKAAVGAYKTIGPQWTFVGFMGVLTALMIMGFYPVVGGWATAYIFKSFGSLLTNPDTAAAAFGPFISGVWEPIIWTIIYLLLNVVVVSKGIAGGIEKVTKVLMPVLFVLLVVVAARGLSLPGASEGVKFLFKPDFSKLNGSVVLSALGQAFFSLSLGMGCMITYGSFLSKEENLVSNALLVTIFDTCCALVAGLAMFPAIFAYGIDPASGPGLIFAVMPTVFAHMGGAGKIMGILFFIAFTFAAWSSSISLFEVVIDYFIEELHKTRKQAVTITTIIIFVLAVLSSLSQGVLSEFHILGANVFDLLDILTDKVYMAIGGALLALAVAWGEPKQDIYNEVTNNGTIKFGLFNVWYALLRYIIPVVVAIISVTGMLAHENRALIGVGLLSIIVMAAFSKKMSKN